DDSGSSVNTAGNGSFSIPLDGGSVAPPPACTQPGLWCYTDQQRLPACTTGATTISGTVYDPAGKNPIYNAIVYVPADVTVPLPTITTGTKSCSTCDTQISNYMAVAVTDFKGNFKLTGDVPSTMGVPLVVQ